MMRFRASAIFAFALVFSAAAVAPSAAHAATVKAIYQFKDQADGFSPQGLIADATGDLFGTTYEGGPYRDCFRGCGTVFEVLPGAAGHPWTKRTVHNFAPNGIDGYNPTPELVMDASGNLYGTTYGGGDGGNGGIVYELLRPATRDGHWKESILATFAFEKDAGGSAPGGLMLYSSDEIIGTAANGGTYGSGVIFSLTLQGGTWHETVLHNFYSGRSLDPPGAGLVADAAGNVFGTRDGIFGLCTEDNPQTCGTVWMLHKPFKQGGQWIYLDLHHFFGSDDGMFPNYPLVMDGSGDLYGTTSTGGSYTRGIVFELLRPSNIFGTWNEVDPHAFGSQTGDGATPLGNAVFGPNGKLFGTTSIAAAGNGAAYQLMPPATKGGNWTETILSDFPDAAQGVAPNDQLIFGRGGALYGTAAQGGINGCADDAITGCGTVFRITP